MVVRSVDKLARMLLRKEVKGATMVSVDERQLKRLSRRVRGIAADLSEMRDMLRHVISALHLNIAMEIEHMQNYQEDMDNLSREVEETQGAVDSMKTFTAGISQRLKALADSNSDAEAMKAALRQYASRLNDMQTQIADAMIANDPDRPAGGEGGGAGEGGASISGARPTE